MSGKIEPCSCAESQHYLGALNEIVKLWTTGESQALALDAQLTVEIAVRARHLAPFSQVRAIVQARDEGQHESCYLCGQPVDMALSCWITKYGAAHLECYQLATETVLVAIDCEDQPRK
jgi:hypothetical protein